VAGAPGTAQSFQTVGDVPGTGDAAGSALPLGFGTTINQRLTQLNIVPATDQDWFSLEGCTGDSVVIETFATRLTPASKLNTVIRVFTADGATLIAENDDLDGTTTDSRLRTMLLGDDQYALQVTSAPPGSSGHYEIDFQVIPGTKNMGTYCQIVKRVAVSPATATIAPGATEQLSATGFDETDATVPGVRFLWVSSNTNVAVVDTTGLVTGMGGGDATISASGHGEPGYAVITVTGPALGAPTQVAFSVQPTTSTAGTAFSPAIDVEIRDANGNLVTDARNPVTLAIANNPGTATLFGTATVNANSGIARFTGLSMDKAAAGYTLVATSTALTGATSASFTITPGAPTKLAFGAQPADVEGSVMLPAVTATILDAFDNVATGATNAVTVDFGLNLWKSVFSPGAVLGGTKTATAVAGVATFSNLRVDKPGAGYTLAATAAGLTAGTSDPFQVTLAVGAIDAAGVGDHTCALTTGGTYCWGLNNSGQLGYGTIGGADSVPGPVTGGLTFTQVSGGNRHTCAITAAGAAYCWGLNNNGQLGNNSTTPSNVPVAVAGGLTFSSISAGYRHTCGVAGTALYCWGYDAYGQLGDDATLAQKLVPTIVAGGLSWSAVTTGYLHTCGRTTGGDAYCWGYDGYGQLGNDAPFTQQPTPVVVAGGGTWSNLSAGGYHTCGVDASGVGLCWGNNWYGKLGADTLVIAENAHQGMPVVVFGSLTWGTVQAGWDHTCGLTTGGETYCWGAGFDGQLGDGTFGGYKRVRTLVLGGNSFTSLSVGGNHTCGLVGTNAWCWGYGYSAQLGDGAQVPRNQPVQIVQ
jgi:alpha-tubulin suppressor-like RCC1 family protein